AGIVDFPGKHTSSITFQTHSQTDLAATPPIELIALNRMAYGPRPGDVARVRQMGFTAYVDEQLNPNDADDALCASKLTSARLRIQYDAGMGYPAVDEMRPLRTIIENWGLAQLWPLTKHPAYQERIRPVEEVRAATLIRAVYSKWQLREVLVEFWHNHFNVDAYSDTRISATWPLYDRDVIRRHCLGNFRNMVRDVAKSIAMGFYLDNAFSRDGPANENYARELFELHTLGQENYLNHLYNRWRDVPGALEGNPIGYIDQDVYEAARAFTGWTIAYGQTISGNLRLPDTGEFAYVDLWHDNAQKRVLAFEIDPNRPPLADGEDVIRLVSQHPGTARYICRKLCRRLLADDPPASLVNTLANVWLTNKDAPDQIARTVRALLLSDEFASTFGRKVKRPFEVVVSFLRATNAEVTPNRDLFWQLQEMGYRMFNWGPPTGHPEESAAWLSTNGMLRRWNIINQLQSTWLKAATFDLPGQTPPGLTARQIVEFWVGRLLAVPPPTSTMNRLIDLMRQNGSADAPPTGSTDEIVDRIKSVVTLIAMTPEFQLR
ncbi:MAG: DUF1800 domain-containing protein, partial [Roseiflexus sp.]|nr:DUF1800 domain-containing protein [Roseiflexus sp.]